MTRKILLADDSITIQKVVELTFVEGGYEVVAVDNGDEALERLEGFAPDVVIADIHMPGADGYEIARSIGRDRPGTPVLLLVGTFEPFEEDDVAASGANGFLMKPFDSQDLLGRVERLLDEAASAPSLPPPSQPSVVSSPPSGPAPTPASETPSDAPSSAADVTREAAALPSPASAGTLSDDDVDRIARRVVELLTPELLRGVVSEVVPAVAETVVRERIRELEQGVE